MKLLCNLIICLLFPMASLASVTETQHLIKNYYQWFNSSQLDKLETLIDKNIIHEINYKRFSGKDNFIKFISENKKNYNEHIDNYILMISKDGRYATTKIKISGEYLHTDDSAIPAHGQHYTLSVLNYFEIKNNKIVKANAFYNEENWQEQVSKEYTKQ